MLTLGPNAKKKYLEMNRQYAKDIAEGRKDTKLADILNVIHDKYKVVQLYPKLGKELKDQENVRVVELTEGWRMLYIAELDAIEVVDFVKD